MSSPASNELGFVRGFSWRDCCPWLVLFRCFSISISTHVLLMGLLGAVLTSAVWSIASLWFLNESDLTSNASLRQTRDFLKQWPGSESGPWPWTLVWPEYSTCEVSERCSDQRRTDAQTVGPQSLHQRLLKYEPISRTGFRFVEPFRQLFDPTLNQHRMAYFLFGGLWTIAVWSLVGGAITRIACVRLGRDERVGLRDSLRHAAQKWLSHFSAPALPLSAIVCMSVPLFLLGLVMRANFGVVFGGLIWSLVLIGGLVMTLLMLGLLFGFPLMWGAISTESSDAFDAISRAYAYTFQRPFHFLFYAVLAAFLGTLGWLLVIGFSEAVISFSNWGISWGTGTARLQEIQKVLDGSDENTSSVVLRFGAILIAFFSALVRAIAAAFPYTFFWCSAAAIYLLLRRDADQTELDDVHVEEDQDVLYGLPELDTDEAGVPGVAESTEDSEKP